MFLTFESRPSPSPYVECVWRCHSVDGGYFHSMAEGNLELVVTRLEGHAIVTLRGPVTRAKIFACPPNGEWLAIRFRTGVYVRGLPTAGLLDHKDLNFEVTRDGRFCFADHMWELPTHDNAEVFVDHLVRRGIIAMEPTVQDAMHDNVRARNRRTIQRRFLRAVGMSHAQFRQIERARHAVDLLREGSPILDVIHDAGYFDQAHLTHSLKRFIGLTPTAIRNDQTQLSFSYKTESLGAR